MVLRLEVFELVLVVDEDSVLVEFDFWIQQVQLSSKCLYFLSRHSVTFLTMERW